MIEARGVTIRYGEVTAVDDVSFIAAAGEVTALVGPNGAGKTSLVEALEGFRRPYAGDLVVAGLHPVRDHRELAPRIGVMLQEGGVHPAVRVGEALRHSAALYPRAWPVDELMEQVGLSGRERHTFRQLSGGEQRRLALALALVGRPSVVFLDEPTAGVDPGGRVTVRSLIDKLRGEGVTVLLASHELDEVERLADRVVMVDAGRVVANGSTAELQGAQASGEVRFRAIPGLDVDGLGARLGSVVHEEVAGEYRVAAEATPGLVAAITGWLAEQDVTLGELQAGRESLESVFFRLTGRAGGEG